MIGDQLELTIALSMVITAAKTVSLAKNFDPFIPDNIIEQSERPQ